MGLGFIRDGQVGKCIMYVQCLVKMIHQVAGLPFLNALLR